MYYLIFIGGPLVIIGDYNQWIAILIAIPTCVALSIACLNYFTLWYAVRNSKTNLFCFVSSAWLAALTTAVWWEFGIPFSA